jgi:hypothetical protein
MKSKQQKGGASLLLAAFWSVVEGFYKDAFFAWVKPMMPDFIIHPPIWAAFKWLTAYGPTIVFAGLGIGFIVWSFRESFNGLRKHLAGSKRMILWVALAFGLLITASAAGALLWSRPGDQIAAPEKKDPFIKNIAGPPIEWRFDKPATIIWATRKPGEGVRVEAIVINGTNKSDFALKNVSAILTADLKTAQVFTMRVNPHGIILDPKESAKLIPPRVSFDLMLAIEPNLLSADEFLQQYGTLHFTFSYEENGESVSFREQFSLSYLEDQIAFLEQQTREQSRTSPTMRGEPYSVKKIDQSVTSHNQSGGITARTVNINPKYQRVLGDPIRQKLLDNVPRSKLAVVWVSHGDQESFRYGNEIFQFLRGNGFKLFGDSPQQNIFLQPLYGVTVSPKEDQTEIFIGMLSDSEKPEAK